MSQQNNQLLKPDNQNHTIETSRLVTRRSIILGALVALVPITALVVAALGTLLTMLSHSS